MSREEEIHNRVNKEAKQEQWGATLVERATTWTVYLLFLCIGSPIVAAILGISLWIVRKLAGVCG